MFKYVDVSFGELFLILCLWVLIDILLIYYTTNKRLEMKDDDLGVI